MKNNKYCVALLTIGLNLTVINAHAQTAPINILNATPLSATAGDTKEVARFGNNTSNASRLQLYFRRHTAGTNWLTASTRIQNYTDVTPQGYLEFNPPGLPGGLTMGTQSTANAFSITDAGNIGIGIAAPNTKLHINRDAPLGTAAGQVAEMARISGNIGNNGTLIFFNYRYATGTNWLTASTRIQNFTDVTSQGFVEFNPPSGPGGLSLGTSSGGYAININSASSVGMGTWDTRGYKLAVVGGILCDRVKVAVPGSVNWADYVFQENYKLMPLEQVEQFIQQNKHLPGVPSANEMVKDGNDLLKTDAKLLEKIEELTLYMIQLKKENECIKKQNITQQKEIDMLKKKVNR